MLSRKRDGRVGDHGLHGLALRSSWQAANPIGWIPQFSFDSSSRCALHEGKLGAKGASMQGLAKAVKCVMNERSRVVLDASFYISEDIQGVPRC